MAAMELPLQPFNAFTSLGRPQLGGPQLGGPHLGGPQLFLPHIERRYHILDSLQEQRHGKWSQRPTPRRVFLKDFNIMWI